MTIQLPFDIRIAVGEDASALAKLCTETFYDTYYEANTPENMDAYISGNFSEQHLLSEINTPNNIIFLAVAEQELIGYISLSMRLEGKHSMHPSVEICRFYVLKRFQHLKVGRKLISKAFEWTQSMGLTLVWLGVWQKNTSAISIYKHLGFVITGTTKFLFGDDVQDDFVMSRHLTIGSDDSTIK